MQASLMGRQGPGRERSTPGVLCNGRQLKKRKRGIFHASHAAKQRASAQRRSLVPKKEEEAEIEGGICSKDNGGKRHPQETPRRWLEKKSYIGVTMRRISAEQKTTDGEEALELATFSEERGQSRDFLSQDHLAVQSQERERFKVRRAALHCRLLVFGVALSQDHLTAQRRGGARNARAS
ncbi:hypothetical protein NDU88_011553 [Pleurodeles waltl]|uniref:Uncharacterized protein n=1 Tax=Pleurodeles waltl TaxID=8319 RepID=A0AAV7R0P0_PLEWA|nr:hypothetical protein NDU88_011553 [Pleurodeles waltl]